MDNKLLYTTVYDRKVLVHLSDDKIEHIRVIRNTQFPIGTVVIGRVTKMLPSSNACFVDIGDTENYFLTIPKIPGKIQYADMNKKGNLHCEDVILVQVSAEAVKQKAPSVTSDISLSGRFVVIEEGSGISFSKKITKNEKNAVNITSNIKELSHNHHIIFRTEIINQKDTSIVEDEILQLINRFDDIKNNLHVYKEKTVLYKADNILQSTISEWTKYGYTELVTDVYSDIDELSELNINIREYNDDRLSLIKLYKLETLINDCLNQKVYLKSGAYLVVEQGETLTSIDVNSAHAIKGDKEEASFKINMEAAEAIIHVLKSRNITGMILIDFINMKDKKHEDELITKIKDLLLYDDVKSSFIDITGLGLVELTRQRKYSSLIEQWK